MSDDDLESRIAELESNLQYLRDDFDSWRSQVYQPQQETTVKKRDDAREQRVELQETVSLLQDRIQRLEGEIENLVGLDDATASDPTKRANDLRMALIREAESRDDEHAGRAQMWWKEVRDFYRKTGHGRVTKPDCYKAMYWAAGCEDKNVPETFLPGCGFKKTTKTNHKGQDVTAVAVDLDDLDRGELPSYANSDVEAPSSDPTTGETVEPTENTEK